MKGIETSIALSASVGIGSDRSDHCPAMKGIETGLHKTVHPSQQLRSDHCPAMKGIETVLIDLTAAG